MATCSICHQAPARPRVSHGAFCSDDEVHRVVADWRRRGTPDYIDGLLDEGGQTPVTAQELQSAASSEEDPESDALYDEAVHYVCSSRRASISSVQRKLRIGYNRAARLIETMEATVSSLPWERMVSARCWRRRHRVVRSDETVEPLAHFTVLAPQLRRLKTLGRLRAEIRPVVHFTKR